MNNEILWLHISDLHFGYNDNAVERMIVIIIILCLMIWALNDMVS